jgi:uncharacterized Tic20 family protein
MYSHVVRHVPYLKLISKWLWLKEHNPIIYRSGSDSLSFQVSKCTCRIVHYLSNFVVRLLTVGFHEMSHAIMGILTCAKVHSVELDRES